MANKKESTPVLERIYNVPLRKEYQKAPRWKRTEKAVVGLRQFLGKHMKSENVLLSTPLNNHLWKHGIKNPPHHVKVIAIKDKEGVVHAELFGEKKAEPKVAKKVVKEETKDATTEPVAEKPKKDATKKNETPQ